MMPPPNDYSPICTGSYGYPVGLASLMGTRLVVLSLCDVGLVGRSPLEGELGWAELAVGSGQDAGAVQNSFIGWAYLSFLVSGGSPKLCSMVVKRL